MSKEKKVILAQPKFDDEGYVLFSERDFLKRVELAQEMLPEEYTIVPMLFDYEIINYSETSQLDTENTESKIEDLIPEAIELYKLYQAPPIGKDVDEIIIQVVEDFKEELKQGSRESTTTIERSLNDSEREYIRNVFINKGYTSYSFKEKIVTKDDNTTKYTRITLKYWGYPNR